MGIKRKRHWPFEVITETDENREIVRHLERLNRELNQESAARIADFDILQLSHVPWVDVRTYGAVGDGTTDDTVAIQAALDQAKKIYIPGGYTFIASNLTLSTGNQIYGDGWKSIIKHQAAATDHLIELEDEDVYGVVIKDVFIHGDKDNQTNAVDAIHFDNTDGTFDYWPDPHHTLIVAPQVTAEFAHAPVGEREPERLGSRRGRRDDERDILVTDQAGTASRPPRVQRGQPPLVECRLP